MRAQPSFSPSDHRLFGVAATIAAHLALIAFWLLAERVPAQIDGDPAETIQWIDVKAPADKPAPQVAVTPKSAPAPAAPRMRVASPIAPPIPTSAPQADSAAVAEAVAAPVAEPVPAKSVQDMLQQARRDIGKIDKELNKELPGQLIKAPPDTPHGRLVKGIELANELAPRRWYEQPKIKELIDPGGYGRRRYRVVTALGTFCVTYDSPQSPDGKDPITRGATPKYTNCPPHEEAAKPQKW